MPRSLGPRGRPQRAARRWHIGADRHGAEHDPAREAAAEVLHRAIATDGFLVTTTAPLQPGAVIKSKYRVEQLLGAGGMGWVVAAEHLVLGQRVALKFLRADLLGDPAVVERFAREARAASRLQSDHVARVIDVDSLDDGTPFIVLEHLEGTDLGCVADGGQPLPPAAAVRYVLEACEAVAEAHSLGIIHRDLKPANLFLAQRPNGRTRIKVLDFGISKIEGAPGDVSVTSTSNVVGSAHYMSPEQMLASRDVDARTDVWSLGVTLYELVTATLPFPGESVTQVCALVMTREPAPPSTVRPELPRELDAIILRCLARDREDRYSSVAELAEALAPLAASDGAEGAFTTWRPAAREVDAVAPPPADGSSTMVPTTSSPGLRVPVQPMVPAWALGAAAAAALVIAGAAAASLRPAAPSVATVGIGPRAEAAVLVGVRHVEQALAARDAEARRAAPTAAPTPHRRAPTPPAAPAPREPAPSCNPPFTIQPDGTRRAKPECL